MRKYINHKGFSFTILNIILNFEHWLYCTTDLQVELPMHKAYYKASSDNYRRYHALKNI